VKSFVLALIALLLVELISRQKHRDPNADLKSAIRDGSIQILGVLGQPEGDGGGWPYHA
jgi:hypothetical protein